MGSALKRYRIVSALRADAAKKTIPATNTKKSRELNSRKFLNRLLKNG
jgi:hypothetical protein